MRMCRLERRSLLFIQKILGGIGSKELVDPATERLNDPFDLIVVDHEHSGDAVGGDRMPVIGHQFEEAIVALGISDVPRTTGCFSLTCCVHRLATLRARRAR